MALIEHAAHETATSQAQQLHARAWRRKPERVCHWAFEMLGMQPEDELLDLFPGTGAVSAAWESWKAKLCEVSLIP